VWGGGQEGLGKECVRYFTCFEGPIKKQVEEMLRIAPREYKMANWVNLSIQSIGRDIIESMRPRPRSEPNPMRRCFQVSVTASSTVCSRPARHKARQQTHKMSEWQA
jgi:hypothetical protein